MIFNELKDSQLPEKKCVNCSSKIKWKPSLSKTWKTIKYCARCVEE